MSVFSGTLKLTRLALKRDRFKLPIWVCSIITLCLLTFPMMEQSFGTEKSRLEYQAAMPMSMFGRMFGGPLDGNSLGSIAMVEMFIYLMVLVAFMSSMTIVRHTRSNEESGCLEVIRSTQSGRFADLTAAFIVVVISNLIIFIVSGIGLSIQNVTPNSGVWMMLFALFCIGLTFASMAAVISQLTTSARQVNMIAGSLIGICFVLRAIGDSFGPTPAFGQTIVSLWPSWLSPFGWAQQIFPFTQQNVWIFWIYIATIVTFSAIAYLIQSQRDLGAGIIADKLGPGRASRLLASPIGLVWRQTWGLLVLWTIVGAGLGSVIGSSAQQFKELLNSNEMMRSMLAPMGGEKNIVNAYLGYMIMFTMIILVAYVMQVLHRMRAEESGGQAEQVFSTAISRTNWIASYITISLVGVFLFTLVVSLCTGIGYMIGANEGWGIVYDVFVSSAAYIPAVLVYVGIIIALFGLWPRLTVAISWFVFVGSLLILLVGDLLKLPNYVMDLVPFKHIPNLLIDDIKWNIIFVMLSIFVASVLIGIISFRNRDVSV